MLIALFLSQVRKRKCKGKDMKVYTFQNNGYNIVIDINSGCVHSVDEVAYDIIEMMEEGQDRAAIKAEILIKYRNLPDVTSDEVDLIFSDIDQLIKQGKLFSDDHYRDMAAEFKERQSVLKAICLHVSHDCNLGCRYCFAGKGEFGMGEQPLMTFEVGKKAFDFLVANSGDRKNLEVDFFGGEPLLNWEVVKELVAYGRELEKTMDKRFRFTLTTNGTYLNDEIMKFCNKEMSNVVMSLDGRKEVNDRMRVTRNGKGSYDIVLPKFIDFAESRNHKNYYIRGTYTHYNTDFAADVLHLADLGFKEISLEPVVCDPGDDYAIRESDLHKLYAEYDKLALEMLKRERNGEGFNFFHFNVDLTGGPCISKRICGCGVGTEYLAITPTGDIYPCHQFVGKDEWKLGNLDTGIEKKDAMAEFEKCNIYAHPECDDCFARMYCSGGCAANSFNASGSVTGYYNIGCKLHRARVRCAIMMQIARQFKKYPNHDI